MKVSIITVCYNSGNTIESTLQCIANQNFESIEHIIIDGGSIDNTLEIISKYNTGTKVVISEPDKGIYDAMNKGIALAKGDIIGILNSDDYFADSNVLKNVVECFNNSPETDGIYGDLIYVNRIKKSMITRLWKAGVFERRKFFYGWMPPHPTVFFKREVYYEIGRFDLQFKSAADYELLLRACVKYNKILTYLPGIMVHMRSGGLSNSNLKNRIMANGEDRLAWKVNGLKPFPFLGILKPLRKIFQYVLRPKI